MTTAPTREQAIDAAGKALAEISRELRRTKRIQARRVAPQPQAEQQSDAA